MRQPEVEEFDWDQQVLPRPEPLFLLARPLRLGPLASAHLLAPQHVCVGRVCPATPSLCPTASHCRATGKQGRRCKPEMEGCVVST